jgi:thiol-disulfide isomerase/thioredoxin
MRDARFTRLPTVRGLVVPVAVLVIVLLGGGVAGADLVGDVRGEVAAGRWDEAHRRVAQESGRGDSPEALEALSWIARGELAQRRYDEALLDAGKTRAAALVLLRSRPLDAEPRLPIALGAAIEVEAQVRAARGERAQAVAQLQSDREHYGQTSIALRIQKNLNLLTLEGKSAPPLEGEPHFGGFVTPLPWLVGKPVLLFFWAHWCPDCKAMAPAIGQLRAELASKGLVVIAPTQLYGAVGGGEEATPGVELPYIDDVRRRRYGALGDTPVPVSANNFKTYGSSSVPTVVVVDRAGKVTLYHPGKMTYDELRPYVLAAAAAAKRKR